MKKFKILLSIFVALFLMTPNVYAQGTGKIAFLDLSKVFDEYVKTKEYDSVLEGKHKAFEEERNGRIEKLREAQGKLALLKEEEKGKVQEEVEGLRAEILEFDRQQKTDLTKERDEKIREVLLEIEKVVSDHAKKEGYTVVLNDRVLIYGSDMHNITDQILVILNENYNKGK